MASHSKKHLRNILNSETICFKTKVSVIGRHIISAPYISRIHARVVGDTAVACTLYDDSLNGVYINCIKIHGSVELQEGDLVTFGHPNGQNIKTGERVRQPDSEFQFLFERCDCIREQSNETAYSSHGLQAYDQAPTRSGSPIEDNDGPVGEMSCQPGQKYSSAPPVSKPVPSKREIRTEMAVLPSSSVLRAASCVKTADHHKKETELVKLDNKDTNLTEIPFKTSSEPTTISSDVKETLSGKQQRLDTVQITSVGLSEIATPPDIHSAEKDVDKEFVLSCDKVEHLESKHTQIERFQFSDNEREEAQESKSSASTQPQFSKSADTLVESDNVTDTEHDSGFVIPFHKTEDPLCRDVVEERLDTGFAIGRCVAGEKSGTCFIKPNDDTDTGKLYSGPAKPPDTSCTVTGPAQQANITEKSYTGFVESTATKAKTDSGLSKTIVEFAIHDSDESVIVTNEQPRNVEDIVVKKIETDENKAAIPLTCDNINTRENDIQTKQNQCSNIATLQSSDNVFPESDSFLRPLSTNTNIEPPEKVKASDVELTIDIAKTNTEHPNKSQIQSSSEAPIEKVTNNLTKKDSLDNSNKLVISKSLNSITETRDKDICAEMCGADTVLSANKTALSVSDETADHSESIETGNQIKLITTMVSDQPLLASDKVTEDTSLSISKSNGEAVRLSDERGKQSEEREVVPVIDEMNAVTKEQTAVSDAEVTAIAQEPIETSEAHSKIIISNSIEPTDTLNVSESSPAHGQVTEEHGIVITKQDPVMIYMDTCNENGVEDTNTCTRPEQAEIVLDKIEVLIAIDTSLKTSLQSSHISSSPKMTPYLEEETNMIEEPEMTVETEMSKPVSEELQNTAEIIDSRTDASKTVSEIIEATKDLIKNLTEIKETSTEMKADTFKIIKALVDASDAVAGLTEFASKENDEQPKVSTTIREASQSFVETSNAAMTDSSAAITEMEQPKNILPETPTAIADTPTLMTESQIVGTEKLIVMSETPRLVKAASHEHDATTELEEELIDTCSPEASYTNTSKLEVVPSEPSGIFHRRDEPAENVIKSEEVPIVTDQQSHPLAESSNTFDRQSESVEMAQHSVPAASNESVESSDEAGTRMGDFKAGGADRGKHESQVLINEQRPAEELSAVTDQVEKMGGPVGVKPLNNKQITLQNDERKDSIEEIVGQTVVDNNISMEAKEESEKTNVPTDSFNQIDDTLGTTESESREGLQSEGSLDMAPKLEEGPFETEKPRVAAAQSEMVSQQDQPDEVKHASVETGLDTELAEMLLEGVLDEVENRVSTMRDASTADNAASEITKFAEEEPTFVKTCVHAAAQKPVLSDSFLDDVQIQFTTSSNSVDATQNLKLSDDLNSLNMTITVETVKSKLPETSVTIATRALENLENALVSVPSEFAEEKQEFVPVDTNVQSINVPECIANEAHEMQRPISAINNFGVEISENMSPVIAISTVHEPATSFSNMILKQDSLMVVQETEELKASLSDEDVYGSTQIPTHESTPTKSEPENTQMLIETDIDTPSLEFTAIERKHKPRFIATSKEMASCLKYTPPFAVGNQCCMRALFEEPKIYFGERQRLDISQTHKEELIGPQDTEEMDVSAGREYPFEPSNNASYREKSEPLTDLCDETLDIVKSILEEIIDKCCDKDTQTLRDEGSSISQCLTETEVLLNPLPAPIHMPVRVENLQIALALNVGYKILTLEDKLNNNEVKVPSPHRYISNLERSNETSEIIRMPKPLDMAQEKSAQTPTSCDMVEEKNAKTPLSCDMEEERCVKIPPVGSEEENDQMPIYPCVAVADNVQLYQDKLSAFQVASRKGYDDSGVFRTSVKRKQNENFESELNKKLKEDSSDVPLVSKDNVASVEVPKSCPDKVPKSPVLSSVPLILVQVSPSKSTLTKEKDMAKMGKENIEPQDSETCMLKSDASLSSFDVTKSLVGLQPTTDQCCDEPSQSPAIETSRNRIVPPATQYGTQLTQRDSGTRLIETSSVSSETPQAENVIKQIPPSIPVDHASQQETSSVSSEITQAEKDIKHIPPSVQVHDTSSQQEKSVAVLTALCPTEFEITQSQHLDSTIQHVGEHSLQDSSDSQLSEIFPCIETKDEMHRKHIQSPQDKTEDLSKTIIPSVPEKTDNLTDTFSIRSDMIETEADIRPTSALFEGESPRDKRGSLVTESVAACGDLRDPPRVHFDDEPLQDMCESSVTKTAPIVSKNIQLNMESTLETSTVQFVGESGQDMCETGDTKASTKSASPTQIDSNLIATSTPYNSESERSETQLSIDSAISSVKSLTPIASRIVTPTSQCADEPQQEMLETATTYSSDSEVVQPTWTETELDKNVVPSNEEFATGLVQEKSMSPVASTNGEGTQTRTDHTLETSTAPIESKEYQTSKASPEIQETRTETDKLADANESIPDDLTNGETVSVGPLMEMQIATETSKAEQPDKFVRDAGYDEMTPKVVNTSESIDQTARLESDTSLDDKDSYCDDIMTRETVPEGLQIEGDAVAADLDDGEQDHTQTKTSYSSCRPAEEVVKRKRSDDDDDEDDKSPDKIHIGGDEVMPLGTSTRRTSSTGGTAAQTGDGCGHKEGTTEESSSAALSCTKATSSEAITEKPETNTAGRLDSALYKLFSYETESIPGSCNDKDYVSRSSLDATHDEGGHSELERHFSRLNYLDKSFSFDDGMDAKDSGAYPDEERPITQLAETDNKPTVSFNCEEKRTLEENDRLLQKTIKHLQGLQHALNQFEENETDSTYSRVDAWRKQLETLLSAAQNLPKTIIAVMGETGAGKSKLLNALLDLNVLPTSGFRACTAVVVQTTKNTQSDSLYQAEIEFLSEQEWQSELEILLSGLNSCDLQKQTFDHSSDEGVALSKLLAVYGIFRDRGSLQKLMKDQTVTQWLGKVKTISAESAEELTEAVNKYIEHTSGTIDGGTQGGGQFWPIVRQVRLAIPRCAALRSGAVLVDLPGGRDENAARDRVARDFEQHCTDVWIVAPVHRAVDNRTAKQMLDEQMRRQLHMDGQYGNVTFICTKTDSAIDVQEIARQIPAVREGLEDIAQQIQALQDEKVETANIVSALSARMSTSHMLLSTKDSDSTDPAQDVATDDLKDVIIKFQEVQSKLEEVRKKEDDLQRKKLILCAKARNNSATKEILRDYKAGLQRSLHEEDDSNCDVMAGETQLISEEDCIKVFCVSAADYLRLLNKESSSMVFQHEEDTGILALRRHIDKVTVKRLVQVTNRVLQNASLFVADILHYLQDERSTPRELMGPVRECFERCIAEFELGKMEVILSNSDNDLTEIIEQDLKPKVFDGCKDAADKATATCARWGSKPDDKAPEKSGYPWVTYRAVVHHQGVFLSSRYGPIDFNAELAVPIYTAIVQEWDRVFNKRVVEILDSFHSDVKRTLRLMAETLRRDALELKLPHERVDSIRHLHLQILDIKLPRSVEKLKEHITDRQRSINRVIGPAVQAVMLSGFKTCRDTLSDPESISRWITTNMAPAYQKMLDVKGTGAFKRIKEQMHEFIQTNKHEIFGCASQRLLSGLLNLQEEIGSKLRAVLEELLTDLTALYQPLWENPQASLVLRNRYYTSVKRCLDGVQSDVNTGSDKGNEGLGLESKKMRSSASIIQSPPSPPQPLVSASASPELYQSTVQYNGQNYSISSPDEPDMHETPQVDSQTYITAEQLCLTGPITETDVKPSLAQHSRQSTPSCISKPSGTKRKFYMRSNVTHESDINVQAGVSSQSSEGSPYRSVKFQIGGSPFGPSCNSPTLQFRPEEEVAQTQSSASLRPRTYNTGVEVKGKKETPYVDYEMPSRSVVKREPSSRECSPTPDLSSSSSPRGENDEASSYKAMQQPTKRFTFDSERERLNRRPEIDTQSPENDSRRPMRSEVESGRLSVESLTKKYQPSTSLKIKQELYSIERNVENPSEDQKSKSCHVGSMEPDTRCRSYWYAKRSYPRVKLERVERVPDDQNCSEGNRSLQIPCLDSQDRSQSPKQDVTSAFSCYSQRRSVDGTHSPGNDAQSLHPGMSLLRSPPHKVIRSSVRKENIDIVVDLTNDE